MKAIKVITHPVLLMVSFLFILISGQHFGGFYLLYLLLAMPHAGSHAVFALSGILLLVFAYIKFHGDYKYVLEGLLNLLGVGCLVLSLVVFFINDRQGYNAATFQQAIPMSVLILFGLLSCAFIIYNILRIFSRKPLDRHLSMS